MILAEVVRDTSSVVVYLVSEKRTKSTDFFVT